MNAVEIKDLSISYEKGKKAVDGVSMDIEEGSIISIVGESGSGKSTLIHGIMGIIAENVICEGKLKYFGKEFNFEDKRELQKFRKENLAIIFQNAARYLNPLAKIGKQYRETLKANAKFSDGQCDEIALDMMKSLHLKQTDRIMDSYPFELSGGMQQRVAIAMAMSLNPKILFADEPTSALDVTVQAQIVAQLMKLREEKGTTIVAVTHNMGLAVYMSDYIGIMQNGKLIEWGKPKEIIENPKAKYTEQLISSIIELGDKSFAK